MLRRAAVFTQPKHAAAPFAAISVVSSRRNMSNKADQLAIQGPPMPPTTPTESVAPMDFNPHIEWFEWPRQIFDPLYPYTRDECMRMNEERVDYTAEELAEKYGVRVQPPFKFNFWAGWCVSFWYIYYQVWSAYRATGNHPTWPQWRMGVMADARCPKITDDEMYLDQWMMPAQRQRMGKVLDPFWAWKPLVSTNVVNPHAVEFRHRDPSEFKHMCGV